jgi:predicted nucleic acid-binding protein
MAELCLDIVPLSKLADKVGWYETLWADIQKKNIVILIGHGKFREEVEKVRKVKSLLISLSQIGKARSVNKDHFNRIVTEFGREPRAKCEECDDPHLFAICGSGPAMYLITDDKRLVKCRTKLRRSSLNRYCSFAVIRDGRRYREHRSQIIK